MLIFGDMVLGMFMLVACILNWMNRNSDIVSELE